MSVEKMRDNQKTKAKLLQEVDTLRKRVAELRQMEEALRESEQKWRSLLNNTPDIVMIVDRDGTIRFINHTVPGIKEQEATGKRVYDYISPEHHDTMRKDLERIFQTGQGASQEISGVGPHGSLSWYQAELGPIRQDGRIVAASIVTRDITERKKAEEEIKKAAEEWNKTFDAISDLVFVQDKDFTITKVNKAFPEALKLKPEDIIGKKCYELLHKSDKPWPDCPFERTVKDKESRTQEVDDPNIGIPLLITTSPIFDDNGKLVGAVHIAKNITERRDAEQSLRESEERLRVALSAAQMGTWRWDPATNQDTRDASFNGILGLEAVESTQPVEDFLQRVHPEDRDMVDAEIQRTLREHCTYVAEFRIVRPDGTVRWLRDQGKPVYDENDHILCLTGAVVDITERKGAEDALRESEKKYKALFQGAAEGIIVADVETMKYKYVNPAICKMLGYTEEELIRLSVQDIHRREDLEYAISEFKSMARGEKILTSNMPCLRKDGTIIYADIHTTKILIDGTQCNVGFFTDVTERKKAEDALGESEKRYRALFQGAAEGIIVADTETKEFEYVNPAICKMLGYTEEELKRLGIRGIHPKEDLQHIISEFKAQARGEQTLTSSIPCLRKDGTIMYADISTAMVLIDERQCNVGFFTDITERKRAEEALRESESKYRTLVENLPQKIFLKDRNSVYVSCNENLARDFKIKSEEIAGKTDYDLVPEELAEKYRADDKRVMESGEAKDIEEKYIQQGQEVVIHTVKTPVKDAQGNVIGILGIFWDITEIKQAEEELDLYREKMAHAEQLASLGTLSATLAHELNQPLTAIRLSIENSLAELETTSSPDTVIEDLKDGLTGVSDAASIVKRFSNLAGKSSGKIVTEVNLKAVAERIVKLLKESARRARVSLQLKGMEELPPIQSNEKDLEQLFFALVENAIQAADGKKSRRLIISGGVKDEHIELRFADNCAGIAPKNLDKIFEPFFTTRPIGERTGLGLCIVERIVSGAGGKIRVESKAGKGSTFFVTLPISRGGRF